MSVINFNNIKGVVYNTILPTLASKLYQNTIRERYSITSDTINKEYADLLLLELVYEFMMTVVTGEEEVDLSLIYTIYAKTVGMVEDAPQPDVLFEDSGTTSPANFTMFVDGTEYTGGPVSSGIHTFKFRYNGYADYTKLELGTAVIGASGNEVILYNYNVPNVDELRFNVYAYDDRKLLIDRYTFVINTQTATDLMAMPRLVTTTPYVGNPTSLTSIDSFSLQYDKSQLQAKWEFDDGTVLDYDSLGTVQHTFDTEGTHEVKLYVKDPDGDESESILMVPVQAAGIEIKLSVTPEATYSVGDQITVSASGSRDLSPASYPLEYRFKINDGSFSSWSSDEEFDYTLQADDVGITRITCEARCPNTGMNQVSYEYIEVASADIVPTSIITILSSTQAYVGKHVDVTGENSTDNGGSAITSYMWKFTESDGSSVTTGWMTSPTYSYTPTQSGTLTIELTVKNADEAVNTTSTALVISSDIPAPNAVLQHTPDPVDFGDKVVLDASGSSDQLDGDNLLYRFDTDGDGTVDTDWSTTPTITIVAVHPTDYNVKVQVKNQSDIVSEATSTIHLNSIDRPDTPTVVITNTPTTPYPGETITLDASGSSDAVTPSEQLMVRWDTDNDGVWDTQWSFTKTHQMQAPSGVQNFTVRAQVKNQYGGISVGQKVISVNTSYQPSVTLSFSPSTCHVGEVITFTADASTGCSNSYIKYMWEVSGQDNTGWTDYASINVTPSSEGPLQVKVTVKNIYNEVASDTKEVTVLPEQEPLPVAAFTYSPNPIYVGDTLQLDASSSVSNSTPDTLEYKWKVKILNTGEVYTTDWISTPTFSYGPMTDEGSIEVSLTVKNAYDKENSASSVIAVQTRVDTPVVDFTWSPDPGVVGMPVAFNATVSNPSPSLEYSWKFGDGNWTDWSTNNIYVYTPTQEGTLTVSLKVRDLSGNEGTKTKSLMVVENYNILSPGINIAYDDSNLVPGETLTIDASNSEVVKGTGVRNPAELQFKWDRNGDGNWDASWSSESSITTILASTSEARIGCKIKNTYGHIDTTYVTIPITIDHSGGIKLHVEGLNGEIQGNAKSGDLLKIVAYNADYDKYKWYINGTEVRGWATPNNESSLSGTTDVISHFVAESGTIKIKVVGKNDGEATEFFAEKTIDIELSSGAKLVGIDTPVTELVYGKSVRFIPTIVGDNGNMTIYWAINKQETELLSLSDFDYTTDSPNLNLDITSIPDRHVKVIALLKDNNNNTYSWVHKSFTQVDSEIAFNYDYNIEDCYVGRTMTFAATSNKVVSGVQYKWEVDNTVVQDSNNEKFTYSTTTPGVIKVKMTATYNGDSYVVEKDINVSSVYDLKNVDVIAKDAKIYANTQTSFKAVGVDPSYECEWTDGTTVINGLNMTDFTTTFNSPGSYNIALTVTTPEKTKHTVMKKVTVYEYNEDTAPTISIQTTPSNIHVNDNVSLVASATIDGNPVTNLEWKWNIEGEYTTKNSKDTNTIFLIPTKSGNLDVAVTAKMPNGHTGTKNITLQVAKEEGLPTPGLVVSSTPYVGEDILLDASSSTPPAGYDITAFKWEFDDHTKDTGWIAQNNITVRYDKIGNMNVRLYVKASNDKIAYKDYVITVLNNKPVAKIEVINQTPTIGDKIDLTGASSEIGDGTSLSYKWEVDGVVTSDWNSYATFSFYPPSDKVAVTIRLIVKNDNGYVDTTEKVLSLQTASAPTVKATFNSVIYSNTTVDIDLSSSDNGIGDGSALSFRHINNWNGVDYDWDSSFAEISQLSIPVTTATNTVLIQAKNAQGKYDTRSFTLVPVNTEYAPKADFEVNVDTINISQTVEFSAEKSTCPYNSTLEYRWDIGNDGVYDTSWNSNSKHRATAPASAGDWTVKLEVRNEYGKIGTITKTYKVVEPDTNPVATITLPATTIYEGEQFTIDGSASYDPSSNGLLYSWDLDGDGIYEIAYSDSPSINLTKQEANNYLVGLKVKRKDGKGNESMTTAVYTVEEQTPTSPTVTLTHTPSVVYHNSEVVYYINLSDDSIPIKTVRWDVGEGYTDPLPDTSKSITILSENSRKIRVQVRLQNDAILYAEDTLTVQTNPDAPVASFTISSGVVRVYDSVTLDASGSSDPNSESLQFRWKVDGNQISGWITNQSITTVFSDAGDHVVELEVKNQSGIVSSEIKHVFVRYKQPILDISITPNACVVGETLKCSVGNQPEDEFMFRWDYDNDGNYDTQYSKDTAVIFSPSTAQTYNIKVEALNKGNETFTATKSVTVYSEDAKPTAQFTPSPSSDIYSGTDITFDGSSSSVGVGGTSLEYAWQIEKDGVVKYTKAYSATDSIVYKPTEGGEWVVTLTVRDDRGLIGVTTTKLYVADPPYAQIDHSPITPSVGDTITFDGSNSYNEFGNSSGLSYEWEIEEGYSESGGSISTKISYYTTPSVNYNTQSTVTYVKATLTVTTTTGYSNTRAKLINITETAE